AFAALAALMGLAVTGVFIAENASARREETGGIDDGAPPRRFRNRALVPVLLGWGWSFWALFSFMAFALNAPDQADARAFTRETGPLIVTAAIIAPVVAAAAMLRVAERAPALTSAAAGPLAAPPAGVQRALDVLYGAVLTPMTDFIRRLGYGALLVLTLVLSYRFADLIWGAFAYPFYLGENYGALGHTLDEVAIASKLFGTLMTFAGIAVGATAILRFGRMPCVFVGAVLAAATNLLFADLALGGGGTDAFMRATGLYGVFGVLQPLADYLGLEVTVGEKLSRLMIVIAAENLAVGFASAASVVYLSSIVNPKHAAVQYALLASLTMLIGSFGRGALGELIETQGFAFVFYLTAALGSVAVVAAALEWRRQAVVAARATAP
ncbi:MAG: beta-lactamase induction signal transducer, partial [Pseudomonadota bacterium]